MNESVWDRYLDDYGNHTEWLSECCGTFPLGEVDTHTQIDGFPMAMGICSRCRDHATFRHEDYYEH